MLAISEVHEVHEVHVVPHARDATWVVGVNPAQTVLSSHTTADEAQLAAGLVAEAQGATCVVLHDRYQRVSLTTPSRIRR